MRYAGDMQEITEGSQCRLRMDGMLGWGKKGSLNLLSYHIGSGRIISCAYLFYFYKNTHTHGQSLSLIL